MAHARMHCRSLSAFLTVLVFWTGVTFSPQDAAGDEVRPFSLSPWREAGFFSAAGALGISGGYAMSRVHAPDPDTLRKSGVPGIDRIALRLHSSEARHWSNITVATCGVLPFLAAASNLRFGDRDSYTTVLIDLVMFAESSLINQGLTETAKGVFHRSRPWAYDPSVPLSKRRDRSAAVSFWSGHSSTAFNAVVFAGYVFQKHHPGSRLVIPVWTVGLSTAAATAALRVRAGQHFPTDVLAGAAAGSLTGWLVPRAHLKTGNHAAVPSPAEDPPRLGLVFSF